MQSSRPKLWLVLIFIIQFSGCTSLLDIGRQVPKANEAQVVGVPPGSSDRHKNVKPYAGPYPRDLERPLDPFQYPIRVGDIGPIEPYFSGPLHYPFLCQTEESGLGQPLIDNESGYGVPVFEMKNGKKTKKIAGYSQDCSVRTSASYWYNVKGTKEFQPYNSAIDLGTIEKIQVNDRTLPFILRVEVGTLNRYIYTVLTIKAPHETLSQPLPTAWNQRLIVQMRGGVGVGFKQGNTNPISMAESRYEQLKTGYALLYSSGLQTSNHYNIWESEEIALRLKRQFTALYGKPLYTVGLGASGGGIQQYLLAQNAPGVIDAAIPQYSYPDMVSQTIYALDCDLLERYFEIDDRDDVRWDKWQNRTLIEGLSARNVEEHEYRRIYQWSKLMNGYFPTRPRGVGECVLGWRGAGQVAHNPRYTHYYHRYSKDVWRNTDWSHWQNLVQFYGTDKYGFANSLWDNVGVQYGLTALKNGDISAEDFIDINFHVGSWRPQHEMQVARFWKFSGDKDKLSELNIWSSQNIRKSKGSQPAPRLAADPAAIQGAFKSGMVYTGEGAIPIIDIRHYVDPIQDMHHSFASFTSRQRIIDRQGNADHQVIIMAEQPFDPTEFAFNKIDEWMLNMLANPELSLVAAKPQSLQDTCLDDQGKTIAEGKGVWDGQWNNQQQGACMKKMPNFHSSRQIAGEDIRDLTFKCQLIPVKEAINRGFYGDKDMQAHIQQLNEIFPDGVCDYSKPGQGEPIISASVPAGAAR